MEVGDIMQRRGKCEKCKGKALRLQDGSAIAVNHATNNGVKTTEVSSTQTRKLQLSWKLKLTGSMQRTASKRSLGVGSLETVHLRNPIKEIKLKEENNRSSTSISLHKPPLY